MESDYKIYDTDSQSVKAVVSNVAVVNCPIPELELIPAIISASSTLTGCDVYNLIDGCAETYWESDARKNCNRRHNSIIFKFAKCARLTHIAMFVDAVADSKYFPLLIGISITNVSCKFILRLQKLLLDMIQILSFRFSVYKIICKRFMMGGMFLLSLMVALNVGCAKFMYA